MDDDTPQRVPMKDEMSNVLEEARMVIPGVQALFGFQTMAVFNNRFEQLPPSAVACYVAGLGLLALAVALLMAPAAYHRIVERGHVSRRTTRMASRLITAGMVPLMIGLALDVYVVCLMALHEARIAAGAGMLALATFTFFWFAMPLLQRSRRGAHDGL